MFGPSIALKTSARIFIARLAFRPVWAQRRKVKPMLGNSSGFIKSIVDSSDIVLFMNGIPAQPQCSLSSAMVSILHRLNAPFKPVNLLSNPSIRDGLKELSNGPAIPQLYVKGELIGGSDIVKEMYAAGALTKLLSEKGVAHRPV